MINKLYISRLDMVPLSLIQDLRRQRQANLWFKASLAYKTEFLEGQVYIEKPYLK